MDHAPLSSHRPAVFVWAKNGPWAWSIQHLMLVFVWAKNGPWAWSIQHLMLVFVWAKNGPWAWSIQHLMLVALHKLSHVVLPKISGFATTPSKCDYHNNYH